MGLSKTVFTSTRLHNQDYDEDRDTKLIDGHKKWYYYCPEGAIVQSSQKNRVRASVSESVHYEIGTDPDRDHFLEHL